jgi:hypothetical protein
MRNTRHATHQFTTSLICLALCMLTAACGPGGTATRERAPSAREVALMMPKTPTATKPADAPGKKEAKNAVLRAQARLGLLKSYRARIVNSQGETEATFEYVLPDRYHEITSTKEQIGIGDVAYTRVTGGAWTKESLPGIGRVGNEVSYAEEFFYDVEVQGQETVDGVLCARYQATIQVGSTTLNDTYWIGLEDGLPHRILMQLEPERTITKILYDFNADIKIEAPAVE